MQYKAQQSEVSNIDCLQSLVDRATQPQGSTILLLSFQGMERSVKVVQKCRFTQLIFL